ncbi:MAG TPA: folate-binding protein YgfZ [Hyphomicrobiales bacterium]|nr:folate-binding protein YgfZ [Kaistiaceae bacterium]HQF30720.1 folate-binding protein YgfZ [Hyphomicrobiales bacterium]
MTTGRYARLDDRGIVAVSGAEAAHFLQGLQTANIDRVVETGAGFGALLTPQGKILFDFLVAHRDGTFFFDLPKASAADFARRLGFYKLRAKVDIAPRPDLAVVVGWGAPAPGLAAEATIADPRHGALGWRAYAGAVPDALAGYETTDAAAWHAHRIGLGVPEAGQDFDYGEVFPHDVDMDCLAGLDFKKGCYVGQEVVSRMQHRSTARRRVVLASATDALPIAGTEITAGGKAVGTLGSSAGTSGLALVRLDRAKAAMDAGAPIVAAGVALELTLPAFASFSWPSEADGE